MKNITTLITLCLTLLLGACAAPVVQTDVPCSDDASVSLLADGAELEVGRNMQPSGTYYYTDFTFNTNVSVATTNEVSQSDYTFALFFNGVEQRSVVWMGNVNGPSAPRIDEMNVAVCNTTATDRYTVRYGVGENPIPGNRQSFVDGEQIEVTVRLCKVSDQADCITTVPVTLTVQFRN